MSRRLADISRTACSQRFNKNKKVNTWKPPLKGLVLPTRQQQQHPARNHLPEGSSSSRLSTLVPFTFHTHFPSLFSRNPVYSFSKYLLIHKWQAPVARQAPGAFSHPMWSSPKRFPAPKCLYLRFLVSGIQFHTPSSRPPSTTERTHSQELLFTGVFGTALLIYIHHLDTEISGTQDDCTIHTG